MGNTSSLPGSRADWHGVKCSSLDDMRTENIKFWQKSGGKMIRQAAWELVFETWTTQNRDPDELRFQRLTTALRRS